MIKIYEDTKVYVLCPSNIVTGGPEALHQLADRLNHLGIESYMVYIDPGNSNIINSGENWSSILKHFGVPNRYRIYNFKTATNIQDNNHNIIVTPEIWPNALNYFKNIQKAIWWLAAPGYPVNTIFDPNKVSHFYQSNFAKQALIANRIKYIYPLSDFTNKIYLVQNFHKREDIVLYNPAKGMEFTKQIMEYDRTLNFIPITSMSPKEIKELMDRAKVYIDFGHHPGKDRIPREAAVSNCCVIVGNRGSVQFYRDVPINEDYIFDVSDFDPSKVVSKIKDCFDNYSERAYDFQMYRKQILFEEINFKNEVKLIFSTEDKFR